MNQTHSPRSTIYIGDTPQKQLEQDVRGSFVTLLGEPFYRIEHYDAMPPFFMSIVSSTNHWLFIASTGGLSAGRVSAEQAIFPYYTEDKLTENSDNTGSKTIFMVRRGERSYLWEPFSDRQRGVYPVNRNLYKNVAGTVLIFEETNHRLGLNYRYAWRTSDTFGFVKTNWLTNLDSTPCQIELVDGLQNILPTNISSVTQNAFSPLLDAYKRSELDPETGIGIFALNSRLTDLAEPSESLQATTVMQLGLEPDGYLLSSAQLDRFRSGSGIVQETDMRGQRGAYFIHAAITINPGAEQSWHLVADVSQDSVAIIRLAKRIKGNRLDLMVAVDRDVNANTSALDTIITGADGIQLTNNQIVCTSHYANIMFNVMRGGIFADQYKVETADFVAFVSVRNRAVLQTNERFFLELPPTLLISELYARSERTSQADLVRLAYGYLPLTFSRRHGDPSRPWNQFMINIKKEDGSQQLDYQGNWRDIFQNWEALAYAFPEYIESMIFVFLNATTVDGYNPYRITRQGIDWERPEADNPWANIGYWSDHQIIYLQKLMEISARVHPGTLEEFLNRSIFSNANVPYRIKPYDELRRDPYNTIAFDWELDKLIASQVKTIGTDGKLVLSEDGQVIHVTLVEKLLVLLSTKLSNFVPEGGIWMSTQRPEWNDANNALVGKGLSVVTLAYLRRYVIFFRDMLSRTTAKNMSMRHEVREFYQRIYKWLSQSQTVLSRSFTDSERNYLIDGLGKVGSDYRWYYYSNPISPYIAVEVATDDLIAFLNLVVRYIDHSLGANKRSDNLYHTYNVLHLTAGNAAISRLHEMLEGQVAILSSGLLSADESLALFQSLRQSSLYQADQHSYILYPDRELPGFLQKNTLTTLQVSRSSLITKLIQDHDQRLVTVDTDGGYHFHSHIRNVADVNGIMVAIGKESRYAALVETEAESVRELFEATFHHDEFTGRSGTFFAYEGLGSIYWHMIAKLLLAAQEVALQFRHEPAGVGLVAAYVDIRKGLSFNKTPDNYGAFPTDPYSHTPAGQGARQPGMTGLVKELMLTRQAELGLFVKDGALVFDPLLLDSTELLSAPVTFNYLAVNGDKQELSLNAGELAYTICQTPVVLKQGASASIVVYYAGGNTQTIQGQQLDNGNAARIFQRDGSVHHLEVSTVVS